jgi:hypothetical protein
MPFTIDQQTITALVQLGGQYFIPLAALLRALYAGMRGRLPQGFRQIVIASTFAGVTAATNTGQPQFDLRAVADHSGQQRVHGGAAGVHHALLLRQPDRAGLWTPSSARSSRHKVVWVYALHNGWPWWSAPLTVAAAARVVLCAWRCARSCASSGRHVAAGHRRAAGAGRGRIGCTSS